MPQIRTRFLLKHRRKRHVLVLLSVCALLLPVAYLTIQGNLNLLSMMVNREVESREAEAVLRRNLEQVTDNSPNSPAQPATAKKSGISLSFAAVKKLLLASDRKKLGGIGKIETRDRGFYGYQIVRLPEDSFFYRLGARKGDIIRKIEADHPVELSSDLDLYALLLRLHEVPELTVTLERDEKIKKFTFTNSDI